MSTIYWKPADCPVRKQPVTLRDHELIAVRRYVENVTVCRRKWLLDHFDVQLVGAATIVPNNPYRPFQLISIISHCINFSLY